MWKLTIEDDQANRTVVPLARDEYSIGRGEDNTVRLTERNISRRHARITREAERWVVFDAGSYNGCYVNGARVSQRQDLTHGDLVQVGDYRLELVDEARETAQGFDSKATMPVAPRSQTLLGQPDRLVMLVGPTPGAEFPLNAAPRHVIGRGEECDISINHPSVSRVHAEVQALGDGRYEVVDRESANGIRVNGVELPRGLLDARDMIELGDVVFKFIRAGDVYVPGADESQQISSLGGFEASSGEQRGMTLGAKVMIGIGAVVLLGTLLVVAMSRGDVPADVSASAPKNEQTEALAKLLSDAKALLDKGDAAAARARANQIPEDSNLRDTPEFRAIQATWADQLLTRASQAEDPAEKRKLLEEVARATAVDSMRRKRAANDLAALGGETIDVTELPSAPRATTQHVDKPGPTVAAAKPSEPQHVPDPPAEPAAAKPAANPATLVRKNPFDEPGAAEIPAPPPDNTASTDRGKLTQMKNRLLAKSRSGTASDADLKSLHAICRTLGDASCSN
ncbi:MAG TPA: FHA domain-containing protein, partial [Polyangiaceae bacterium]|nr:FHA domain-containing protein [Polyangiaceae bacterium]